MKHTLLLVCCAMAFSFCEAQKRRQTTDNRQRTTDNRLRTVDSIKRPLLPIIRKVKAADVRAMMDSSKGPTIINFWATWCGPCVRELTYFDSIIATRNADVKLVLVSLDFPEAYVRKLPLFVQQHSYKGEVIYLNESNADVFIPAIEKKWNGAIPASIFLNNTTHQYEMFNMQMTRQRFALELDKIIRN